jgi:hypothetical protein
LDENFPVFFARIVHIYGGIIVVVVDSGGLLYIRYCCYASKWWGTQWCSWLRQCPTSQKASGSIPHGVMEIFHLFNPSSPTMSLGLTQFLTEMSTRNIY